MVEQLRSLDKRRLAKRLGVIEGAVLNKTLEALQLYFAP